MGAPAHLTALSKPAKVMRPLTRKLLYFLPELEWDLRRVGYKISAADYIGACILLGLQWVLLVFFLFALLLPLIGGRLHPLLAYAAPLVAGAFIFLTSLYRPRAEVARRARLVERDLEFMIRDILIQVSAGVPLFTAITNIAKGGYGECSRIAADIVREVRSGKALTDVLNEYGMIVPSENFRRTLWQISNATRTGSDVRIALEAISDDLSAERENTIRTFVNQMGMWSFIYLICSAVLPSLGVVLFTVLLMVSPFFKALSLEAILVAVLGFVLMFQVVFLSFVTRQRPI